MTGFFIFAKIKGSAAGSAAPFANSQICAKKALIIKNAFSK